MTQKRRAAKKTVSRKVVPINQERTMHFIAGLPRAGSTLLANLLMQNPDIYTTPTSCLHDILLTVRKNWEVWIEHRSDRKASADHNLKRVLKSIMLSYHDTDRPVVLDKGRGWLHLIEMIEFILDRKAKVIVPVRDMTQVFASVEKLYRAHAHRRDVFGDFTKGQTVEGRCQSWIAGDAPIGLAYNRIKDALAREMDDRLLFVEFRDLTFDPEGTMESIYEFLEMDYFDHDFNNVEQVLHEDDRIHGWEGLHDIRKEVKPVKDDSEKILGKTLHKEYTGTEIWRK